jgi:hypothetical protein
MQNIYTWQNLFKQMLSYMLRRQNTEIDFRNIHWEVNFATFSLSDSQNKGYVCITGNVRGYAHIVIEMLRWARVVICVVSVCQIVDQ